MKNILKEAFVGYAYMIVCLVVYYILIHYHVRPYYPEKNFGFWTMVIVWFVTLYGGEFLSKRANKYFLKRKGIKIAKQMGYKESDIEKIEVFRDGDDDVVDITFKDDTGDKE